MIRFDLPHVVATCHPHEADTPPGTRQALVNTLCTALEIHAQPEEEIFYPAMQALDGARVEKSVPEHDEMRRLVARLRGRAPGDDAHDFTLHELMRDVLHHVAEEETLLLRDAGRRMPDRLAELGATMTGRRLEPAAPRSGGIAWNMMRGVPVKTTLPTLGPGLAGGCFLQRSRGGSRS